MHTIYIPPHQSSDSLQPGASSSVHSVPGLQKIINQIASDAMQNRIELGSPNPVSAVPIDPIDEAYTAVEYTLDFFNSNFLPEPGNPDSSKYESYMDYYKQLLKEGQDATADGIIAKMTYRLPNQTIINHLCGSYFRLSDKILEVGCGKLLEGRTSYLFSHFPENLRGNVTYSDANPTTDHSGDIIFKQAEIETLSDSFGSESFDHVVSCNVFDTLRIANLPAAFAQAFKVLKPGGKLIIFAAIQPFQNTLFEHYGLNERTIAFPLIKPKGCFKGLQIIACDYLVKWIEEQKQKNAFPRERELFKTLLRLKPIQREILLQYLSTCKGSFSFSNLIEELFHPHRELIDNVDFYEKNMRQGLITAGFKIKEFEVRSGSTSTTPTELPVMNKNNYFSQSRPGLCFSKRSYIINPDVILLNSKLHVIVAKKPE